MPQATCQHLQVLIVSTDFIYKAELGCPVKQGEGPQGLP